MISTASNGTAPFLGQISATPRDANNLPGGWAPCNGQYVDHNTYPDYADKGISQYLPNLNGLTYVFVLFGDSPLDCKLVQSINFLNEKNERCSAQIIQGKFAVTNYSPNLQGNDSNSPKMSNFIVYQNPTGAGPRPVTATINNDFWSAISGSKLLVHQDQIGNIGDRSDFINYFDWDKKSQTVRLVPNAYRLDNMMYIIYVGTINSQGA